MRILFVHEVSYRKKVIFEMHEFPELLASRGHEIEFFNFDEGAEFWAGGLSPRRHTISGRVYPDSKITISRPLQLGIPGLDRLLVTLTSWFSLDRLLARGKFDAVVLLAVPTYGLQTLWAAKRHGVPVIFRALDVSHKIRNNVLGFAIKWVEKRIYNRADLVLGNNPAMTEYCQRLGNRTRPSETLLAPVDLNHFASAEPNAQVGADLGIHPSDLVITYMGSFFYFSGLDEIIRAYEAAVLAGHADSTKLLLIGGGEQDTELRNLVEELQLQDKVIFTGFISYDQLPGYLALSTVAINPLKKSLVTDTALPHKVLQYLALGLPVVSTPLKGLQAVFGDSAGIRWADNPTNIIDIALELAGKPAECSAASVAARESVRERLSFDGAVDALEGRLKEVSFHHD